MTEYWVSNAKKFCDVCKCWIADNKVSVQFHENGKRHKENVKKKITDLVKKSTKEQKKQVKIDEEMKNMEKEALKAYLIDAESNPDLSASGVVASLTEAESAELSEPSHLRTKRLEEEHLKKIEETKNPPKPPIPWMEAISDQGHTYFWNVNTNESIWQPPKEGYVSLDDQKAQQLQEGKSSKEAEKQKNKELQAAIQRQKMKEKYKDRVKANQEPKQVEASPQASEAAPQASEVAPQTSEVAPQASEPAGVAEPAEDLPVMGPKPRTDPYGAWTTVIRKPEKKIDLQLPEKEEVVPIFVIKPSSGPRIKERVLDSGSIGSGPAEFKRRKLHSGRSVRQRQDDDD